MADQGGTPECPEGYRRYVYRIDLKVPQSDEIMPDAPDLSSPDGIKARLRQIDRLLSELRQEQEDLRKKLRG